MEFKPGIYKLIGCSINSRCWYDFVGDGSDKVRGIDPKRYYVFIDERCIQNIKQYRSFEDMKSRSFSETRKAYIVTIGDVYYFGVNLFNRLFGHCGYYLSEYKNKNDEDNRTKCLWFSKTEQHYFKHYMLKFHSSIQNEILKFKKGLYLTDGGIYNLVFKLPLYSKCNTFNYNTSYLTENYLNTINSYIYDSQYKHFLPIVQHRDDFFVKDIEYLGPNPCIIKFLNPLQQKIMDKLINKEPIDDINKELLHSKLLEVSEVLKTEINSDTDLKPRLETLLDMCLDMINYV